VDRQELHPHMVVAVVALVKPAVILTAVQAAMVAMD
jgi:hypothetical protein